MSLMDSLKENDIQHACCSNLSRKLSDNRAPSPLESPVINPDISLESLLFGEDYPIRRSSQWLEFYELFPKCLVDVYDVITDKNKLADSVEVLKLTISKIKKLRESLSVPDSKNLYDKEVPHGKQHSHALMFDSMLRSVCATTVFLIGLLLPDESKTPILKMEHTHSLVEDEFSSLLHSAELLETGRNGKESFPTWRSHIAVSHMLEYVAFLRLVCIILCEGNRSTKGSSPERAVKLSETVLFFKKFVNDVIDKTKIVVQSLLGVDSTIPTQYFCGKSRLTTLILATLGVGEEGRFNNLCSELRNDSMASCTFAMEFLSFNLDRMMTCL